MIATSPRPCWVVKGAIVVHVSPKTNVQTIFVLHKLQQQRGTADLYLLPNEITEQRYPLKECRAAAWADFTTLSTVQVRGETWTITHPQRELAVARAPGATEADNVDGQSTEWLVLCEVYTAALQLAEYFSGEVVLPQSESLAKAKESLTAQWADDPEAQ